MVEVTKPDYLSLVNKGGSGFNVSELVTSMVASEIEPKRILQNSKLEKTENAISGIGYLNSQAATTQGNFSTISGDTFFDIASSNSAAIEVLANDETKLQTANRTISDVQIAKRMVFELAGFSSKTDNLDPAGVEVSIDVNFGTWIEDSDAPDTFIFSEASGNTTQQITFTDKSLTQVAALFNEISGMTAQIVDVAGDGSSYSLILSSEDTGAANGFKLSETNSNLTRWETTADPSSTAEDNSFSQLAVDARFLLDGVQLTRSNNTITDIVDGADIVLKADTTGDAAISISRSETAIRQSINDTIFSLNEFKDEIDRLTFIDIEGDENGPLALETAATMLKTNFKKLAIEPLVGYGSDAIYLSQLGIKTNSNGEYYLDETIFEKTLSNNPDYFLALKDANLSSNSASATVTKSQFTSIPAGSYTVSKDTSNNWFLGDTALTQVDLADGGSQFTSVTYPGLVIKTADRVPAEFDVYVGKSFAQKMIDLMTDTLDLNSSLRSAEDSYKSLTEDIEARLEKLDEREKLISSRYTEQFGAMEQAMTQFNSTKSMLENFIESWKKQK